MGGEYTWSTGGSVCEGECQREVHTDEERHCKLKNRICKESKMCNFRLSEKFLWR